jgi:hypothetical protein
MSNRAPSSGINLTEQDAAIVKGMLQRGDRQHDVAAYYGVNGGRIGEISVGKNYRWVVPAPAWELPSPGPYPVADLVDNLAEMSRALAQAEERLAIYAGTV